MAPDGRKTQENTMLLDSFELKYTIEEGGDNVSDFCPTV